MESLIRANFQVWKNRPLHLEDMTAKNKKKKKKKIIMRLQKLKLLVFAIFFFFLLLFFFLQSYLPNLKINFFISGKAACTGIAQIAFSPK